MGSSVEVSDTSQGADVRARTAPLDVPPVFSGAQEKLAAGVVRVFVEDPVAFHHIGRGDVSVVESLTQVWAVFVQLHRLTTEIRALEDLHPIVSIVLGKTQSD